MKRITTIYPRDRKALSALSRCGYVNREQLSQFLRNKRIESYCKDGLIEKSIYSQPGSKASDQEVYRLTSKGRDFCRRELSLTRLYSAQNPAHDLVLADRYFSLSESERETWQTETQSREIINAHIRQLREQGEEEHARELWDKLQDGRLSMPDAVYTRSDGISKYLLCTQHRSLLYIILHFGNGVMLLPQLRVFCLTLGLYANGQAVNRAVRELREADILNRQTWIDSNSDLVLCRKYVYCFFTGKAREEVATPRRPNTMAPYILQARKIDWLLLIMEKNHLTTLESVEKYLLAHGCTVFLRLPDLLAYYEQCAPILAQVYPSRFQEQTEQLRAGMEQRSRLARGEPIAPLPALSPEPVATLEKTHRRVLYISGIYPQQKTVCFALFAGREAAAQKVMDWVIDAHSWVISLLPDYNTILYVYALDANHEEALKSVLTAVAPKSEQTPYYRYRLEGRKFAGRVRLGIIDSHFVTRWCGGVCRTHSDRH